MRERQAELVPQLEKEVAEARAKLSSTAKWPDQTDEEHRQECEQVATPNLGGQLSQAQRRSFLSR
eukprot:4931188-Alexandrium_andersonii.AAC.1